LVPGKPVSERCQKVTRAALLGLGVNLLPGIIKLAGEVIGNSTVVSRLIPWWRRQVPAEKPGFNNRSRPHG
jgi:hypothetical protein